MFGSWKFRRKSMGAITTAPKTNGVGQNQTSGRKRSILEFFRRSRRRKQSKFDATNSEIVDENLNTNDITSASVISGGLATVQLTENALPSHDATVQSSPAQKAFTDDDVQTLFSGAPQFSGELIHGRVQVSIAFPWNFDLKTRDVTDAKPIPHAAYSGCTLRQHLPRVLGTEARDPVSYDVGLVELPSMLASAGTEPGTVGINFFAEEPDADILNAHTATDEESGDVLNSFSNFELLEGQPEKLGIRKFDFAAVVERLVELSAIYESTKEKDRAFSMLNRASSGELYSSLFGKILTPPKYDNTTTDPTGLKVQIETLINILGLKRVWFDFSNVEWRIRVGQLLFSDGHADVEGSKLSEPEDGLSERDVVLLQLLLSCELYSRLEAVASLGVEEVKTNLKLTADEVNRFREVETRKTRWDLVLAKRFLENIDAKTYVKPKFVARSETSITRTLLSMVQRESLVQIDELDIAFAPRRQDLQLDGLFHFANALQWPDREMLRDHLNAALASHSTANEPASPSIYATPLSTPGTMTPRSFRSERESGYFAAAVGSASPEMTPRSFQLQPPSRLDLNSSAFDNSDVGITKHSIGGWLTRSYLTGFVLPGEAICHLLISALLENDADAIVALGENANLYGGFVYKGRSYWSKSCVLGRILACLPESQECMGWVANAIVPDGYSDGWLDVHSLPLSLKNIPVEEGAFERNTDFLGGQPIDATSFADFALPENSSGINNLQISLEGLRLEPNTPTAASSLASEPVLSATLDFIIRDSDESTAAHEVPLMHLVQFVSSYPCTPPSLSTIKRITSAADLKDEMSDATSGHLLHKSHRHRQLHASHLLDPRLDLDQGDTAQVTMVDARGAVEWQLLARAWCSSIGENALIARHGTTCYACAIREAKGLGLNFVIQI